MSRPNLVDVQIGRRVRERRRKLGITQEQLGVSLDVRQQQVTKYENGTNRLSANALYVLAKALEVPCSYFFDGVFEGCMEDVEAEVAAYLANPECRRLSEAFLRIRQPAVRKAIIAVVEAASLWESLIPKERSN